MDKFMVGQKVMVKRHENIDPNAWGNVFFIKEARKLIRSIGFTGIVKERFEYILSDGKCCGEEYLEPIHDGDEKSTWSECAWKPKSVETQRQT